MKHYVENHRHYQILSLELFALPTFDHRGATAFGRLYAWAVTFLVEAVLMVLFGAHSILYGEHPAFFNLPATFRAGNKSDPLTQTMGCWKHAVNTPRDLLTCPRDCGKAFHDLHWLNKHLSYPTCEAGLQRKPCPQWGLDS